MALGGYVSSMEGNWWVEVVCAQGRIPESEPRKSRSSLCQASEPQGHDILLS